MLRRTARTPKLDVAVRDRPHEGRSEPLCDRLRRSTREVHHGFGGYTVVPQAVRDVTVLFEVTLQRKMEERALRCDQLHTGREAALDQGHVDRREHLVQVMHVRAVFDAFVLRQ